MAEVSLGVTLPQFTDDPATFSDGVRRAEGAGLDSLWLFDHLWPLSGGKTRPILECWTALAWLATRTTRATVGTLVTRSSLRHPALLGKMAATVGEIAPGRVTIAVGSGDHLSRAENEAFGLPYLSGEARVRQLDAVVEAVWRYLHEESVTMSNEHVWLDSLPPSPRPRPPPRIWVAGRSEGVLDVAARWADGWNAWGCSPDAFAADAVQLLDAAGGRQLELTWGGVFVLGEDDADARRKLGARDPSRYVVGGPASVAGHLAKLIEAGASHLIASFPDAATPGSYELFAGPVRDELGL